MNSEKSLVMYCLKKTLEDSEQKIVYYAVPHHFVIIKGERGIGLGKFLYWATTEATNLNYRCPFGNKAKNVEITSKR